MAQTLVQKANGAGNLAASATATFGVATTGGNLLWALVHQPDGTETPVFTMPAGWATVGSMVSLNAAHTQVYRYEANPGGITGVSVTSTVTGDGVSRASPVIEVREYHDSAGILTLDQHNETSGNSTTPSVVTAGSASGPLVVVVGSGQHTGLGYTTGTGYGNLDSGADTNLGDEWGAEDALGVAGGGAITGAFTIAGARDWTCHVASFVLAPTIFLAKLRILQATNRAAVI